MRSSNADVRDVLPHNLALDGIRGMAIALVMLFHLLYSHPLTRTLLTILSSDLARAGWVGVDLFFALSGFLLTGILFDSLADRHFFRNFYLRRLLRIAPLYYAVLVVIAFIDRSSLSGTPFALVALYLQNTSLWWHHVYPATPLVSTLQPYWSLAVEEQFYLVWPVIVFLVRSRRRLMGVALLGIVLAPLSRAVLFAHGASLEALYKLTFCRADSLLCGAWLALAVRGPMREHVLRSARWVFWAACAGCIAIAIRGGNFDFVASHSVNLIGYTLLAFAGSALIGMALRNGTLTQRFFTAAPLRWLGRYSYGLYLWHWIVNILTASLGAGFFAHFLTSPALIRLARAAVQLAIALPLAVASFHFYEKPFLKLKRFFNYDRTRSTAPM